VKWISVKDQMPEALDTVIVRGGIGYFYSGKWFTLTGEAWPGKIIQWEVTHWMPLPDPPTE